MFGWLKAKVGGLFFNTEAGRSYMRRDVEAVLRNVVNLPANVQRSIAHRVFDEILVAITEIEKMQRPSDALDEKIREQLEHATANRHQAIMDGASDAADPNWAAAALVESWLMANTGKAGRGTFEAIDGLIMGWIRATLTTAEIEARIKAAEQRT
ncbi:MAG: hypothetical protein IIA72_19930 [Proteobacteria bacterium]|nr:hypothetical protein [Pseudomonadota bacterium]